MANEYLQRTPTSTGNRKVFTWASWIKIAEITNPHALFGVYHGGSSRYMLLRFNQNNTLYFFAGNYTTGSTTTYNAWVNAVPNFRDAGNWMHLTLVYNTSDSSSQERLKIYLNGVDVDVSITNSPGLDSQSYLNSQYPHYIGAWADPANNGGQYYEGEMSDIFLVDGQALTPDVFGFYKDGKGYQSSGPSYETDFRPGQWVPKAPRTIKSEINRKGGFGVNGYYLPMNDSSNFGADFHTTPNSIITLKGENLPQPRNGAPDTTDAYVSQLRSDPYAANLVLAVPGITGAPGVAYTDFSANIKGSGTNKTLTANGNAGVAVTASYYGSAMQFDGSGDYFDLGTDADFNFGSGDFTIEFWRNKSRSDTESYVARLDTPGGSATSDFWFGNVGGVDGFYWYEGGTGHNVSSPSLSTGQWDHLAAERYGNTITLYVNGVAVGINTTVTYSFNNGTADFRIGGDNANSGNINYPYQGSIQDLRVYKGVAKYTGGFDVPKPYTPVGIGTWRQVPDCTANNFATWDPLDSNGTFSNGNLTFVSSTTAPRSADSNFAVSSGKWYAEIITYFGSTSDFGTVGIVPESYSGLSSGVPYSAANNGIVYRAWDGQSTINGTASAYGDSWTDGDVIGIAIDMDAGNVTFYKNGISQGSISYGQSSATIVFGSADGSTSHTVHANFGQNPTFSGTTTAGTYTDGNGKGLFKYQPPSGFLALCEDNLPTPAIADPGEHFKVVLYKGDGDSGRSIRGCGFKPDLIWLKNRTGANWHVLCDSVRGPGNLLYSNENDAEDYYDSILSFDSDGFSVSHNTNVNSVNISGGDIVAWCWKAGGAAVSNTDGSIASQISVNQDSGFSIVSYTGNGTGGTIGHGLSQEPELVIIKDRDSTFNWIVYNKDYTTNHHIQKLNLPDEQQDAGTVANNDYTFVRGSSTLTVSTGTAINTLDDKYIAYCWHSVENFSKIGSFTGNGDADGPFIWCGFKPAWVMVKNIDDTGGRNWGIQDSSRKSTNPCDKHLKADASEVENSGLAGSTYQIDLLSNGFKVRNNTGIWNNSGETIIFMAFAESPFQTANAK